MKSRVKLALSIAVVVAALGVLDRFLHWMNLPSDTWFYLGLLGALTLLIVVPTLLAAIWRAGRLQP